MEFKSILVNKIIAYKKMSPNEVEDLVKNETHVMSNSHIEDIIDFFKSAQKIMICGDYDFDGISSTTIAALICESLNIPYGYYIPDRIEEGYGTSSQTVNMAFEKGYTDLLMVDNGVKAYEAIQSAKNLGMKVAIVDHHIMDDSISVDAFLHPDLCEPYFRSMCAAGLMACVAEAMDLLTSKIIALAGCATIADVMPLHHKNREWVKRALVVLENDKLWHFDSLVGKNRYNTYSSKLIAFQLVPKINSIGRLSDQANVNTAVRFFLSNDREVITAYTEQVNQLNNFRKKESKRFKELALKHVDDSPVQIISSEEFHEGLLGIVANQVALHTQKPTIILKENDTNFKGSARSTNLSLQALFSKVDASHFSAMGGHDFAYGMTLNKTLFTSFKHSVWAEAEKMHQEIESILPLEIDFEWITPAAVKELSILEPFGEGNELPTMAINIPEYEVKVIKGYGYRLIFSHPFFKEAVYFTQDPNVELDKIKTIIGNLDTSSPFKASFLIEAVV